MQSKQLALNYATNEMNSIKAYAIESGDRVPNGTFDKIIFEAEEKWGLENGTICKATMLISE
jgi:hypothetical protein